jgi:signal transduction histidine kinase
LLSILDWFIPDVASLDRSLRAQTRNFIATHLLGPLVASPIGFVLLTTDPSPWPIAWIVVGAVSSFWVLPFVYRRTCDLRLCAILSVQILCFACLFAAFHYGGMTSPFLPWLIVALMLGFFYLNHSAHFVLGLFAFNFGLFYVAYLFYGFSQRIPVRLIETVGWASIASATLYMSWMAVYYAILMRMGSDLELEATRHRDTAVRLRLTKERAEKADRTRSIFLAKMSHELRTPLNAVIGYSEMLLEAVESCGGAPGKKRDLERINGAGKHLLALVADVMDLTKIERNEIELKPERFDLDAFFHSVTATTQHLFEVKSNRFVYMTALDEEPLRVAPEGGGGLGEAVTDPTKLRQVIINLLSNAAKFTEDGVVTLAVRREIHAAGDWIEVQVRDTGLGIGPEERARLFQAYGQASAATSRKYGGTGLGLAISQKLCALMGGGVGLTSEKGKGSCFTVRIPATWDADACGRQASRDAASRPEGPLSAACAPPLSSGPMSASAPAA